MGAEASLETTTTSMLPLRVVLNLPNQNHRLSPAPLGPAEQSLAKFGRVWPTRTPLATIGRFSLDLGGRTIASR